MRTIQFALLLAFGFTMSLIAGEARTYEVKSFAFVSTVQTNVSGAVTPPIGTYNFNNSTTVTFSADTPYQPDPTVGIRYALQDLVLDGSFYDATNLTLLLFFNTSIEWRWNQEVEITVDAGNGGSQGGGWKIHNGNVSINVFPPTGELFSHWEGDVDGLNTNSQSLSFIADRPRNLRVVYRPFVVDPVLTITSPIDSVFEQTRASPALGNHSFRTGTTVEAIMLSPVLATGAFQNNDYWIPIGWRATGSLTHGSGTNTGPFVITEDTAIRWEWERAEEVRFPTNAVGGSVSVGGDSFITGDFSYYSNSRPLILTAQPDPGYAIDYWEDVFGVRGFSGEETITLRFDTEWNAIRLTAVFKPVTEVPMVVESTVPGIPPSTNTFNVGDVFPISAAIPPTPPAIPGGGWYEFEGWSGTGDIPAAGTTSTVGPFTITRASTLKWHWKQINLGIDGDMDVQIQDVRNGMLTWPSEAGFQYRIEAAEELFGPYNTLAENIAATPPENSYQLPGHPKSGAHFFRVVRTPQ